MMYIKWAESSIFFSDVINPLKKDVISPLAKSFAPVAKPIVGALVQQATKNSESKNRRKGKKRVSNATLRGICIAGKRKAY
jgi:hypothetical protein